MPIMNILLFQISLYFAVRISSKIFIFHRRSTFSPSPPEPSSYYYQILNTMPTTIGGATTESASQQGNLPPGGVVPPATNNSGQNNMHTQPPEISRPQHGSPSFSPHNDPVSTPPDPPPADNNVLNQPDIAAEVDDDDTLHPIRTAVPSSASRQLNFGTAEEAPDQSPLAAALNASTFPIMNPNHLSYQQDDNNLPIATVVGTSLHPLPSAN